MNRRAFVSGHSTIKVNLSIFNAMSSAERTCGDELQPEEHIFWNCKLHEDQRGKMMDIFSENSQLPNKRSICKNSSSKILELGYIV
jgi:hypothetical protein